MKRCTKCGEVKALGEFPRQNKGKDGLSAHCRLCISEYDKIYYAKHAERIALRMKAYHEANKDQILRRMQAYREANRERIREKGRTYYAANRERMREKADAYAAANRERMREKHRASCKVNRDQLTDAYIRKALDPMVRAADVTPELIEAKRQVIIIYRFFKEQKARLLDESND